MADSESGLVKLSDSGQRRQVDLWLEGAFGNKSMAGKKASS